MFGSLSNAAMPYKLNWGAKLTLTIHVLRATTARPSAPQSRASKSMAESRQSPLYRWAKSCEQSIRWAKRRISESLNAAYLKAHAKAVNPQLITDRIRTRIEFSLILPADNPDQELHSSIQAIRQQYYHRWQLMVGLPSHDNTEFPRSIVLDRRITLRRINNARLAGTLRLGLDYRDSPWVVALGPHTILEPDALAWVALAIEENPSAEFIYADQLHNQEGELVPEFKPAFSREHLWSRNFIGGFIAVKHDVLTQVERTLGDSATWLDLVLQASGQANGKIKHIPQILFTEKRLSPDSRESQQVLRHLESSGIKGEVRPSRYPGIRRVWFVNQQTPRAAVIIPTRDGFDLVKSCLDSLRERTNYPKYQIYIIDNGSTEPRLLEFLQSESKLGRLNVFRYSDPFNYSAMHNKLIARLETKYSVLVNNDVCDFSEGWLEQLIATAETDYRICGVGSLLRYPSGLVQHGGMILGLGRAVRHAHALQNPDELGYFGRLHCLQEVSSVTAALALIRNSAFQELGGFDVSYPTSFGEVDFWLRARKAGYRIIYNPMVNATHHESLTRGRCPEELQYQRKFKLQWKHEIAADRYYSKHLCARHFARDLHKEACWKDRKRIALRSATISQV